MPKTWDTVAESPRVFTLPHKNRPRKRPVHLSQHLQRIFGYSSFRANQEAIVKAILSQQDSFAVMPTGGGKSLCYQLPATMMTGACLVISPLISLMKDQVDAANAFGIKAGLLNSTLSSSEQAEVFSRLLRGDYSLLYLSPERLALPGFLEKLRSAPLSFIAIDEAHCISEWGHDFRPDYLALSALKKELPGLAITAFTATATPRVQEDIIRRLGLQQPLITRASFDRPNLLYQVRLRDQVNDQIAAVVTAHPGEAGIIYRLSRTDVEKTADFLQKRGIKALPYHAGLTTQVRSRNQDALNRDAVQVIVATVAFGMGIDKSNIRFVIHGDLPKSMEGYYQETGRAGRDGEPALCLLFYSRGDYRRLKFFIDQLSDEREQKAALVQLGRMLDFAEQPVCRRRAILRYFDEQYGPENCGACDICLNGTKSFDATIPAQKVMSAIYRTEGRFGAGHIVDIICGSKTERITALGHDQIKTYGAGREKNKRFWRTLIDRMLSQGLLTSVGAPYPLLQITTVGEGVLFGREKFITPRIEEEKERYSPRSLASATGEEQPADPQLFALLRQLRYDLAKTANIPPFVIFSDKSLRQMSVFMPQREEALLQIHGVGQVKLEQYGQPFLTAINSYMADHPDLAPPPPLPTATIPPHPIAVKKADGSATLDATWSLIQTGLTLDEIAKERGLKPSTIATHIGELLQQGKPVDIHRFVTSPIQEELTMLFKEKGLLRLGPIVEAMQGRAGYEQAHIIRGFLISQGEDKATPDGNAPSSR